uniref:guanylate cyclase n=1 Tax=Steinernema glaseri TaxID=37863 RepID=A0A1I7YLM0_9BILA
MIGWMHLCVQRMVTDRYGADAWKKILFDAGIDPEKEYESKTTYEDEETFQIVRSISISLDLSVEAVWEMFGEYVIDYAWDSGFDTLLLSMANNLKDFMDNLNSMHFFIDKLAFNTDVRGPTFQSQPQSDGTIRLHYYSLRKGIYPIVIGLLRQVNRRLFDLETKIVVTERSEVRRKNGMNEHVIYTIESVSTDPNKNLGVNASKPPAQTTAVPQSLPMSAYTFCCMFPTHICFNRQLIIEHCGIFLTREFNLSSKRPTSLSDFLTIVQPNDVQMTFKTLIGYLNSIFIFQVKHHMKRNEQEKNSAKAFNKPLFLKGQMVLVNDGNFLLYLNSPHVTTVRECLDVNIYLNDMQSHDAMRDVIMLNQSRMCQRELNKKLEETVRSMKLLTTELEEFRTKTDHLMFDRIPPDIAHDLRNGIAVKAQEFASATCLITVLCNFDIITVQCEAVDIITMMTDLFHRYDRIIEQQQCYKVLSIVDSYFIIDGAPIPSDMHAEKIMNVALAMLMETKQVKVPIVNLPLMLKAGIHTGSIVAGVMGTSKIRYGVLGETVNVTKRLTNCADRGTILVSNTAKVHALKAQNNNFVFETRGYIHTGPNVATYTHFLIRNTKKSVWELTGSQKPNEASIDGYRELHAEEDQLAWETVEKKMKKQRQVIAAFRGERLEFARAAEKLRSLKKSWTSSGSNDSGISRGSRNDSTVCSVS